jgi:hypothetical protein
VVDNVQMEGSEFGLEKQCRQDHGDKNPSDEGDTKPSPPYSSTSEGAVDKSAISDSTAPVSNGAGVNPTSNTQSNADETQRIGSSASAGRDDGDFAMSEIRADGSQPQSQTEALESLPDPDDLDEDTYPCQVRVVVGGFRTRQIIAGNTAICVPDGPNFEQIYVFNSTSAAQQLCAAISSKNSCSGQPPCGFCGSCSIPTEGCEPAEGEPAAIIGYRGGGVPPLSEDLD